MFKGRLTSPLKGGRKGAHKGRTDFKWKKTLFLHMNRGFRTLFVVTVVVIGRIDEPCPRYGVIRRNTEPKTMRFPS